MAAPAAKFAVADCILLLAHLMGQYRFALWRLSSTLRRLSASVTLHGEPAGGFTR